MKVFYRSDILCFDFGRRILDSGVFALFIIGFLVHVWVMENNDWPLQSLTNEEILSRCTIKQKSTPISGIYLLIKRNQIIYIGQTVNIDDRIRSHCGEYGIDFDYYLLFTCERNELRKYECLFIERFFPRLNNDTSTMSKKIKIVTARLRLKENKDYHDEFMNKVLNEPLPFENKARLVKQIEHRFFEQLCTIKTPNSSI